MNKTEIKNVKAGQMLYCEFNEGEFIETILVTEVNDKTVTGRIDYTSSAYGSAIVTDHLEEGKKVTIKWDNVTEFKAYDDEKKAEKIERAAKKRIEYAKTIINGDKQIVQSIDMEYKDDCVAVEMASTLPDVDSEGVPELCKCWYDIYENLTKERAKSLLSERFRYVSCRGEFLPETRLTFKSKGFKFEGTLESGIIVCKDVVPDKLLDAVNVFIEGARSQYGKLAA